MAVLATMAALAALPALGSAAAADCTVYTDSWHQWRSVQREYLDDNRPGVVVFGFELISFKEDVYEYTRTITATSASFACYSALYITGGFSYLNDSVLQWTVDTCDGGSGGALPCVSCAMVDAPHPSYDFSDDCRLLYLGVGVNAEPVEYSYQLNTRGVVMVVIIVASVLVVMTIAGVVALCVFGCTIGRCCKCGQKRGRSSLGYTEVHDPVPPAYTAVNDPPPGYSAANDALLAGSPTSYPSGAIQ